MPLICEIIAFLIDNAQKYERRIRSILVGVEEMIELKPFRLTDKEVNRLAGRQKVERWSNPNLR